jgi:hypothetical protein
MVFYVCQVVTTAEGEALAKEYNIHFFETSAKQDINVEKAFITIAKDVKNRMIVDVGTGEAGVRHRTANIDEGKSGGRCC